MITGLIAVIPYMPRFETVNVAPESSAGVIFPESHPLGEPRVSRAIAPSDLVSASYTVGTISASSAATAKPTLTRRCSSKWPSA